MKTIGDGTRLNILEVDFFPRSFIGDDQSDAGWRSDWSAVLVTESTHSRAHRLLLDFEATQIS